MAPSFFRFADLMGRSAILVLNSFYISFLIATLMGFLAGLGVGGGSLLVLWLTLVLNMSHPQARIINLMFFIPSALIACLFRWKQGSLELKKILPAIIAGCISAGVCSFLGQQMDIELLKKLFGGLLLLTGLRELFYMPKT